MKGRERGRYDAIWRLLSGHEEGGGERQTAEKCPVSNCTYAMYSTAIDLSFSYLRSAVEASLDIKKDQVDPNKYRFLYKTGLDQNFYRTFILSFLLLRYIRIYSLLALCKHVNYVHR